VEAQSSAATSLFAAPPIDLVRIGMVGVGLQGGGHVENFLKIAGCRITAVCDIRAERTDWATGAIVAAGHPRPTAYTQGSRDFERLCETEDLDLVFTATPWEWHVPVMLAAMKNSKHTATEVPAAMTLDDCWALVEAAERHRRHCVVMENCNYDRPEMMVFNIVRQGLLGEVLHAEGGYLHDLRAIKFEKKDEGLWRRAWSMKLDGNLYPTHGLGPVANCLDINRGDRFDYLVSMSGPSRGLYDWAREHFPDDAPERREKYVLGDVNTSLIKTARGRTVMVQHCTNLPRPYSRINLVQGTKGMFQGYPNRLYIEGRGKPHQWVDAASVRDEFDHPLWQEIEARAAGAGHGGMDYIEDYRLIKCLREGLPTDMNVYDAAALSAVVELSVRSNARRARAVDFPDFTRGRWRTNPRLEIVHT
jgi:predicted dehydrogenase